MLPSKGLGGWRFPPASKPTVLSANEIVLIGNASVKSSAVGALQKYLVNHRIDLLRRVKATEIVDLSALTEPQIEAIAKRQMIAVA